MLVACFASSEEICGDGEVIAVEASGGAILEIVTREKHILPRSLFTEVEEEAQARVV